MFKKIFYLRFWQKFQKKFSYIWKKEGGSSFFDSCGGGWNLYLLLGGGVPLGPQVVCIVLPPLARWWWL